MLCDDYKKRFYKMSKLFQLKKMSFKIIISSIVAIVV